MTSVALRSSAWAIDQGSPFWRYVLIIFSAILSGCGVWIFWNWMKGEMHNLGIRNLFIGLRLRTLRGRVELSLFSLIPTSRPRVDLVAAVLALLS